MYFTNIQQRELLQFHEVVKNNFNARLTDVKNNPLFKVDNIGNLMKIYPLFYTDRIESSNKNDRILDNKCIICEDKTDTLLFFIVEDNLILNLGYSYYGDFTDYLVFYLYDTVTGDALNNIPIKAAFNDGEKIIESVSDKRGIVYLDTSKITYNRLEIVFNENTIFNWSE